MDHFPYHIRQMKIDEDAAEIAALIRVCFRPWLDECNLDFLYRLEKAGKDAAAFPLWTNLTGFPFSMEGIVCTDQSGEIIGVVSTSDFYLRERKCSLIANVCVSPAHRGKGIAAHMLEEAARMQRENGVYGLYLQTRTAQPGLVNFYKKRNFSVTDFRETWILPVRRDRTSSGQNELQTGFVPREDADRFTKMLDICYPETVRWNLVFPADLFKTGRFAYAANQMFSRNRFLRMTDRDGRCAAWGAIQTTNECTDVLWLLPEAETPDKVLSDALKQICEQYKGKKALKLDVPADNRSRIYAAAGFVFQQTLAWMWRPL